MRPVQMPPRTPYHVRSLLLVCASVLLLAGCRSEDVRTMLPRTTRVEIRPTVPVGADPLIVTDAAEVAAVARAARGSLEPTGSAAGYDPPYHIAFVLRDGRTLRAMLAPDPSIFAIPDVMGGRPVDRHLSAELRAILERYVP